MTQEEISLKELFGDFLCMKEGEKMLVERGHSQYEFRITPVESHPDTQQESENAGN